MTDWRALCEELAGWIERSTRHYIQDPDVLIRARAALTQPEPEGRPAPAATAGLCELADDLREQASQGYCEFISREDLRRVADVLEQLAVSAHKQEPAVVPPSDDELLELAQHHSVSYTMSDGSVVYPLQHGCDMRDDVLSFARAVLARWGHQPAPVPVAEGEVGELVTLLRQVSDGANACDDEGTAWITARVADVLEHHPAPAPVPVAERLPEPSVKVLAHYFNDLGKGRTICAIWVPAKTRSDSYGDDDFTEYDEESDTFYWPEGWYEAIENWDDLGYVKVDEGEVIYWQPLPKWPAHALPLPSGEVE